MLLVRLVEWQQVQLTKVEKYVSEPQHENNSSKLEFDLNVTTNLAHTDEKQWVWKKILLKLGVTKFQLVHPGKWAKDQLDRGQNLLHHGRSGEC